MWKNFISLKRVHDYILIIGNGEILFLRIIKSLLVSLSSMELRQQGIGFQRIRLVLFRQKNDENKFVKQFTKYALEDGLCLFKRNSVIGKAWIKQAAEMKLYHKPSPSWYNSVFVGRSSSRLFDHNGILYCSYHAERVEMPEDMFQEIKGSDFYKIMEEIEEGNDSK